MNPLVVAILLLGGICLALIIWLFWSKTYYEGQIGKCEKAFYALAGIGESLRKILEDEKKILEDKLEKYLIKEEKNELSKKEPTLQR